MKKTGKILKLPEKYCEVKTAHEIKAYKKDLVFKWLEYSPKTTFVDPIRLFQQEIIIDNLNVMIILAQKNSGKTTFMCRFIIWLYKTFGKRTAILRRSVMEQDSFKESFNLEKVWRKEGCYMIGDYIHWKGHMIGKIDSIDATNRNKSVGNESFGALFVDEAVPQPTERIIKRFISQLSIKVSDYSRNNVKTFLVFMMGNNNTNRAEIYDHWKIDWRIKGKQIKSWVDAGTGASSCLGIYIAHAKEFNKEYTSNYANTAVGVFIQPKVKLQDYFYNNAIFDDNYLYLPVNFDIIKEKVFIEWGFCYENRFYNVVGFSPQNIEGLDGGKESYFCFIEQPRSDDFFYFAIEKEMEMEYTNTAIKRDGYSAFQFCYNMIIQKRLFFEGASSLDAFKELGNYYIKRAQLDRD